MLNSRRVASRSGRVSSVHMYVNIIHPGVWLDSRVREATLTRNEGSTVLAKMDVRYRRDLSAMVESRASGNRVDIQVQEASSLSLAKRIVKRRGISLLGLLPARDSSPNSSFDASFSRVTSLAND